MSLALERRLNKGAWALTAAVLALVAVMRVVRLPSPFDLSFLPPVHAALNSLTAVALVVALVFIKRGDVARHRAMIYCAMGLSTLFLLSYAAYHFTTPEVRFGDSDHDGVVDAAERVAAGGLRTVYLLLLLSHVVLAAVALPLILLTFARGYAGQTARHKAMARWVFPLWLYVAATGPACYAMLRPYY